MKAQIDTMVSASVCPPPPNSNTLRLKIALYLFVIKIIKRY
jgi:hypothetical protein